MKQWKYGLFLLFVAINLVGCSGNDAKPQDVPADQQAVQPAEQERIENWDVNLTNGTGREITAIRIRSGAKGEWSEEILQGEIWPTDIYLTVSFTDMEASEKGWEIELTFDGEETPKQYTGIPMNDYQNITLTAEGYEIPEASDLPAS